MDKYKVVKKYSTIAEKDVFHVYKNDNFLWGAGSLEQAKELIEHDKNPQEEVVYEE